MGGGGIKVRGWVGGWGALDGGGQSPGGWVKHALVLKDHFGLRNTT